MQARLILLLLVGSSAAAANAGTEARLAPCDALAAQVKSAAADPSKLQPPQGQAYDDYDPLFAPIIRFPPPTFASAALRAKARRFLDSAFGGQDYEVEHVAGPVWRASQVAGTAHCQTERFFSTRPDGKPSAIDTPAVFGDLCWSSSRRIGKVRGRPALIEQELKVHPLLGVDLEITPWTGNERRSCQVSVRFNDAFHVTEQFCKDASICAAALPLAPKLSESLARADDGATLAAVAPPAPQQAQALAAPLAKAREKFDNLQFAYNDLPTFGAKAATKYSAYAGTPRITLIAIPGQTLIARVGLGGIGWRELGDYLITLYRGDGEDFDPVASFVVERKNVGLRSVATSIPQPYVNTP